MIYAVITLGLLLAWEKYHNHKTINKLVNSLVAEDAEELHALETKPTKKAKMKPSDLIPEDSLSNKDWYKKIIKPTTNG